MCIRDSDKVAHVVREIFDLALAGNGIAKICKHINKQPVSYTHLLFVGAKPVIKLGRTLFWRIILFIVQNADKKD